MPNTTRLRIQGVPVKAWGDRASIIPPWQYMFRRSVAVADGGVSGGGAGTESEG